MGGEDKEFFYLNYNFNVIKIVIYDKLPISMGGRIINGLVGEGQARQTRFWARDVSST
jgi:hypothetical protein